MPDPTPISPSPTPSGPSAGAPAPAGPSAAPADPWKDFQTTAAAYDGPGIKSKWAALVDADKKKLKGDGDTQMHIISTIHKEAVPILGQGGVDFSAMQTVFAAYISPDFGEWMAPLKTANIFDAFLNAPPKNQNIPIEYAKKLGPWLTNATSVTDAKKVFAHVYQPAQDTYTRSGWTVNTSPWTVPTLAQLYNRAISYNIPIAHANTIRGWYMVTSYQQPGGTLQNVGGALYWGGSMNEVWFTPGQTNESAGLNANGTGTANGSAATNPLDHFTNAVLHEIGHGVGDRIEGNAWAQTNSYTAFQSKSRDSWGTDLWSGDFWRGVGDFFGTTDFSQDDCRKYMLDEIQGLTPTPPNGATPAVFNNYLDTTFAGQELYKAWKKALGNAERYKNPWFHGGKCYAYLSRWGGHEWAIYNKTAWDARVSDYSMSSPAEFFAEQYTEYYRPCIGAASQSDSDRLKGSTISVPLIKTYLDQVDRRGFDPATGTASGTAGVVRGAGGNGQTTSGGGGGGGGSAPPEAQVAPVRPIPWP